ncbi:MAG TPA: S-adenosylmethionine:tRNA ribosyltransferase-isomerase [Acidimicrobiales bacterium]|jgi:S-adenosylmethionine:tRNA ribosyltransferase-isomerase|nr:S-adenosylmethionine:tRNA ribosyltransferase-isomerase [Acidimicrobiales bacterium]
MKTMAGPVAFELPAEREAGEPAEVRAGGRDDVRLMVASRSAGTVAHRRFGDIVEVLDPGDLVVLNTSGTVAAALVATRHDGTELRAHLSTPLPDDRWLVELRVPSGVGSRPFADARPGEALALRGGGALRLVRPWEPAGHRLWVADLDLPLPLPAYLSAHGAPVRYSHVRRPWPLTAYRTVYATEDGSAEMPSAGRAFTPEIVTALVARGVGVAPVVLHSGVSSPEAHEAPAPERFRVPPATARWLNATRDGGGRVVAVGTSVVRALETVADASGRARPGEGWTELVIGAERGVRLVDGLLTGWHEPEASHLRLLEAVAGRDLLDRCYHEALARGYLWHEFGDLCLLLP